MTAPSARPRLEADRSRGPVDPPTLVIVEDRLAIGPPAPGVRYLVLDMSWTPLAGERDDVIPLRPLVTEVLRTQDLFGESLDLLDASAERLDLPDRFTSNGITWWFQIRSILAIGVQERLLWCYVLQALLARQQLVRLILRVDRPGLADAAAAVQPLASAPLTIEIEPPEPVTEEAPAPPQPALRPPLPPVELSLPLRIRRVLGRVRRRLMRVGKRPTAAPVPTPKPALPSREERASILAARVAEIGAGPEPAVLSIVMDASFHTVQQNGADRRVDPYVTPILDRLAGRGVQVPMVVIGLDHKRTVDWRRIDADPRIIPASYVELLTAGEDTTPAGVDGLTKGFRDLPPTAAGFELGPAIETFVIGLAGWFTRHAVSMLAAERLLETLRPTVLFMGWESARTAWLGAARRGGIPSMAVQHGVVYPRTPDYVRPPHPALVRPDLTCVFGPYERDLLVGDGGYLPDAVAVTGSPRIDPVLAARPASLDEKEQVRAELGIRPEDRLLVVSAGRRFMGDTIHGLSMAARMLAGPFPGVHIVVKLHPEARQEDEYGALLRGLAAAGGYEAAPVTSVRDIDIYRLLRSADAHLGIYSTVLTDAVLTGTPNMIAMGQALEDVIGYVDAGVATPVHTVDDVGAVMADPRPPSPEARAAFLAAHYTEGDATERIVERILGLGTSARGEPRVTEPTADVRSSSG